MHVPWCRGLAVSGQEWKTGDEAYVEAKVSRPVTGQLAWVWVGVGGILQEVAVDPAALLPVSVPDGDAIVRVTDVIDREGYWPKPEEGVQEYAERIARALHAANLLASPVREPGRSEGEEVGPP